MSRPLRIGDAEREQAAADLAEHFAQGRLTIDEHDERLDAIWTARTGADLAPVFEDLPRLQPLPAPVVTPARSRAWSRRLPVLPVIAALVVLSIVTGAPFWVLIFVLLGLGVLGRGSAHPGWAHPGPSRRCG